MVQAGQIFNLTANGKYLEMGRSVRQILHKSDTMGQHKNAIILPRIYFNELKVQCL